MRDLRLCDRLSRNVPSYTRLSRSDCNMCHATLVCRGAKPHMPGYTRLSRSGGSMCHATLVVSVPLHRLQTNSIVSPRSESSSSKACRAPHRVAHWSKYGIRCQVDFDTGCTLRLPSVIVTNVPAMARRFQSPPVIRHCLQSSSIPRLLPQHATQPKGGRN